jgi:Ca2+-binding EF-hand superfamily protein
MRRLSSGIGVLGLTGLLAFATPPGAALANEEAGKEFFQKMDTSGDGKISRDEHTAAARTMFDKMDADKDGRVTAAEMDTAREHIVGKKGMKAPRGKAAMSSADKIKVIDTDGDDVISADEHAAGAVIMFDKMDTDGDGFLTKTELEAGHDKLMHKSKTK